MGLLFKAMSVDFEQQIAGLRASADALKNQTQQEQQRVRELLEEKTVMDKTLLRCEKENQE